MSVYVGVPLRLNLLVESGILGLRREEEVVWNLYLRVMKDRGGRAEALEVLDKCQEEDCYSCEPSPSLVP